MKKTILILLFFPFAAFAQITGRVVAIADGDTFTLLTDSNRQIKIRLYGIDCPERGQDFGNVCKTHLSDLIFAKRVVVQDKGLDRYGRTLGIAFFDNVNVNENMITEGMAWHFKRYDNNENWAKMEVAARSQRKGLWYQDNPIPPWEWRNLMSNRKKTHS